MARPDLARWVLRAGTLGVGALAVATGVAAGPAPALGVAAGGAVSLANFHWLARDVGVLARTAAGPAPGRGRLARLLLRQGGTLAALGAVLVSGWVHPVGVAVGLAVLPPILLLGGLRAAREAA
jgi:hypothetical protein